jgi:predicted alpha/beta superfamily hydrolase
LSLVVACATAAQLSTPAEPVPVTIPQSESSLLQPHTGGEAYRIYVGLPLTYGQEPERRYPVVYAVDADVGFASAVEISRFLALAGEVPEVIVVGIGYGVDLATWRKRRVADLTPVPVDDQPGSGQAGRFLDFIEGELIPLIERRYRIAPNRTLTGYSLGGLFGTYVLFHRPGLFQSYMLGSPSYGWAQGAALQWPAAMGETSPLPTGTVFTSIDTAEAETTIANWRVFWDAVEKARVPGLEVIRGEIDETHAGGWPHAMVKGAKAVLGALLIAPAEPPPR